MKSLFLPILGVMAFIALVGFYFQKGIKLNLPASGDAPSVISTQKRVNIGDKFINVEVADSPEERSKGLSNRQSLSEHSGMLFVFETQNISPVFWMKDMAIPIDIIWINDGKIVKIDKNVPVPQAGTPDEKLKLYSAGLPIDYVLEVNAGYCDKNNFIVGDAIDLSRI